MPKSFLSPSTSINPPQFESISTHKLIDTFIIVQLNFSHLNLGSSELKTPKSEDGAKKKNPKPLSVFSSKIERFKENKFKDENKLGPGFYNLKPYNYAKSSFNLNENLSLMNKVIIKLLIINNFKIRRQESNH